MNDRQLHSKRLNLLSLSGEILNGLAAEGASGVSEKHDKGRALVGKLRQRCSTLAAYVVDRLLKAEFLPESLRGRADIALRTVRPERGDLIVTKLFTMMWRPAATTTLAALVSPLRTWSDVAWIGGTERMAQSTPGRWYASELSGVLPRLSTTSLRVQIAAVEADLGAALLPAQSIAHYHLVPLELAPKLRKAAAPWPEDDVYLVTHRALRRVPRVVAVWEFFAERARSFMS